MGKNKSLWLGFVVGGMVSATATLLYTPSSGSQIRSQTKDSTERLRSTLEALKEEGKGLSDQLAQTSKEGVTLLKSLSTDMKKSIESWKQTMEPHQRKITKSLQEIEESLKELEEKTQQNTFR
ncbi:YtxH domain-containing protein [Pontibacillus litoralis]|uniref:Gas vesicle protein n=1 Tax=Pontibacillus litoralis JSM 072002 TaxID=1385512 RepID=A0A0A5FWT5_9BACI|nr:YtxH domain-containing protein [Pontibacillus litoralis]KGX85266.1 hypothetical protein N784_09505 [Pontibacillus litoralis JSM 072002]